MANVAVAAGAPVRPVHYGSISKSRRWALRWSYFFLVLFCIFFLMPPIYMFITSIKGSAEISAATNPWWVFHPTLDNYVELLTKNEYLVFFRNSALVSVCVVIISMLISVTAAFALARMKFWGSTALATGVFPVAWMMVCLRGSSPSPEPRSTTPDWFTRSVPATG